MAFKHRHSKQQQYIDQRLQLLAVALLLARRMAMQALQQQFQGVSALELAGNNQKSLENKHHLEQQLPPALVLIVSQMRVLDSQARLSQRMINVLYEDVQLANTVRQPQRSHQSPTCFQRWQSWCGRPAPQTAAATGWQRLPTRLPNCSMAAGPQAPSFLAALASLLPTPSTVSQSRSSITKFHFTSYVSSSCRPYSRATAQPASTEGHNPEQLASELMKDTR